MHSREVGDMAGNLITSNFGENCCPCRSRRKEHKQTRRDANRKTNRRRLDEVFAYVRVYIFLGKRVCACIINNKTRVQST